MAASSTVMPPDSPEARRYNRIRRWLGIAEFVLTLAFLIVLVVTGWTFKLQNFAYLGGLLQSYSLALFVYVMMLVFIGKVLGLGLDFYGYRLEHRYGLSNQKLRGWVWDEVKGFLLGTILAVVLVELL